MMARVVSLRIPDLMNADLRRIGQHNTVEVEPGVYELQAETDRPSEDDRFIEFLTERVERKLDELLRR